MSVRSPPLTGGHGVAEAMGVAAVLDDDRLDGLEEVIGRPMVDRLLTLLDHDLQSRSDIIRDAIHSDARAAVVAEAHALKGAAFNLGAARIGALAQQLECAAAGAGALGSLGRHIADAAQATQLAIRARSDRSDRA